MSSYRWLRSAAATEEGASGLRRSLLVPTVKLFFVDACSRHFAFASPWLEEDAKFNAAVKDQKTHGISFAPGLSANGRTFELGSTWQGKSACNPLSSKHFFRPRAGVL